MISPDIERARALLEKAEREVDPVRKATELAKGLQALREYDEEEDTSEEDHVLIKNIKAAHARRLLAQLEHVRPPSFGTWARYVWVLIGALKDEVRTALTTDDKLNETFNRFVRLQDKELGDLLCAGLFEPNKEAPVGDATKARASPGRQ